MVEPPRASSKFSAVVGFGLCLHIANVALALTITVWRRPPPRLEGYGSVSVSSLPRLQHREAVAAPLYGVHQDARGCKTLNFLITRSGLCFSESQPGQLWAPWEFFDKFSESFHRFHTEFSYLLCVLPSVGFDCFHISLSRVPGISISFLFWVGQDSCSVEDCIFTLCTFPSSASESSFLTGAPWRIQGISLRGADFDCTSNYSVGVYGRLGPSMYLSSSNAYIWSSVTDF